MMSRKISSVNSLLLAGTLSFAACASPTLDSELWSDRQIALAEIVDASVLASVATTDAHPEVRKAAVARVTDQSVLKKIALEDASPKVRQEAVMQLTDQTALVDVSLNESTTGVRNVALVKLTDQEALKRLGREGGAYLRLFTVSRLTEEAELVRFAMEDEDRRVRMAACARLGEHSSVLELAKKAPHADVREAATHRIGDAESLIELALTGESAMEAVQTLKDEPALARVALESKNKVIRQAAIKKLTNEKLIASVAIKSDSAGPFQIAIGMLTDMALIQSVALEAQVKYAQLLAAEQLTDQAMLLEVALSGTDAGVRKYATGKLTDQAALAKIVDEDPDYAVRYMALLKLKGEEALEKVAITNSLPQLARSAATRLKDKAALARVAMTAKFPSVRALAMPSVDDQSQLAKAASTDEDASVRLAAVSMLTDQEALREIALADTDGAVRLAAVRPLTDQATLMDIAKTDTDYAVHALALHRIEDTSAAEEIAKSRAGSFWVANVTAHGPAQAETKLYTSAGSYLSGPVEVEFTDREAPSSSGGLLMVDIDWSPEDLDVETRDAAYNDNVIAIYDPAQAVFKPEGQRKIMKLSGWVGGLEPLGYLVELSPQGQAQNGPMTTESARLRLTDGSTVTACCLFIRDLGPGVTGALRGPLFNGDLTFAGETYQSRAQGPPFDGRTRLNLGGASGDSGGRNLKSSPSGTPLSPVFRVPESSSIVVGALFLANPDAVVGVEVMGTPASGAK